MVRGGSWPSPRSPLAHLALLAPENRLGTVSCGTPEPSPRSPLAEAQALRSAKPRSHAGLCDLIAVAICLGRSLRDLVSPPLGG